MIWKILPGEAGIHWPNFLRDRVVAVGDWDATGLGDLIPYNNQDELKDHIMEIYEQLQIHQDIRRKAGIAASQLWHFSSDMQIDDIIIAYCKRCIRGIGRVQGGYIHNPNSTYFIGDNYLRDVEWIEINPIDVANDIILKPIFYGRSFTIKEVDIDTWAYINMTYPDTVI